MLAIVLSGPPLVCLILVFNILQLNMAGAFVSGPIQSKRSIVKMHSLAASILNINEHKSSYNYFTTR